MLDLIFCKIHDFFIFELIIKPIFFYFLLINIIFS